eukprot:scaffold45576_cov67-Phaeocystis_antarctica.AAC.3
MMRSGTVASWGLALNVAGLPRTRGTGRAKWPCEGWRGLSGRVHRAGRHGAGRHGAQWRRQAVAQAGVAQAGVAQAGAAWAAARWAPAHVAHLGGVAA